MKRKAAPIKPIPRCSICGHTDDPREWKGRIYCPVHTALIADPERRRAK